MIRDQYERESELAGRAVPEWVGSSPDAEIPAKVKARIFRRFSGRCYLTGVKLKPGDYDFDHIKPLWAGGEHREMNLAPIWRKAHREKTSAEATPRAKADRIYQKHHGLKTRKGRSFNRPADAKYDWNRGRYVRGEG